MLEFLTNATGHIKIVNTITSLSLIVLREAFQKKKWWNIWKIPYVGGVGDSGDKALHELFSKVREGDLSSNN